MSLLLAALPTNADLEIGSLVMAVMFVGFLVIAVLVFIKEGVVWLGRQVGRLLGFNRPPDARPSGDRDLGH